ncbi:MAG: DUF2189 domain-containing protein [Alphaproteobacteria bacterium]|nr:MAG: DUF2189 domain-containing protein [Alphaproteobacteria bacterium]
MAPSPTPRMTELSLKQLDLDIRTIEAEAPWEWLAQGWRDMWSYPGLSLAYGAIFAGIAALLSVMLAYFQIESVVFPLAAGFLLAGPVFAIGLYELSRRKELDLPVSWANLVSQSPRSMTQLGFFGVVLLIAFLAWTQLAILSFALFFGINGFPPVSELVNLLLFTPSGLIFIVIGTIVGAAIAFCIFAISAVSVPMLMVRDVDAITAALVSIECVRRNFWPMLLWAWLIAMLVTVGLATLFVGLIVTFPLVGHATWHAYRNLIRDKI